MNFSIYYYWCYQLDKIKTNKERRQEKIESRFKVRKNANHLEKLASAGKYKRKILSVMACNKLNSILMK